VRLAKSLVALGTVAAIGAGTLTTSTPAAAQAWVAPVIVGSVIAGAFCWGGSSLALPLRPLWLLPALHLLPALRATLLPAIFRSRTTRAMQSPTTSVRTSAGMYGHTIAPTTGGGDYSRAAGEGLIARYDTRRRALGRSAWGLFAFVHPYVPQAFKLVCKGLVTRRSQGCGLPQILF
jgi:hypothetical protein